MRLGKVSFRGGVVSLLLVIAIGLTCTQSVVAYNVGDDGEPVHEYIAEQALTLYSNDEINTYFGQIQHGAEHEDLLDHVYDRSGACTTITHFWDADKALDDPVDSAVFCANGENAWQKAQKLWGMALGEYASGDKNTAYEYLGHVVHLLSDMTVPAHVHEDIHWPDDDCYEDWMTRENAELSQSDSDWLSSMGLFEIPDGPIDPLFYLFYTTNQIGDFFPSDDYNGDTHDNWGGWMNETYSKLGMYSITKPRTAADLSDNDSGDNNNDGDLGVIRKYSYLHSIRAVATLYELFDKTVSQNSALTIVIERIKALDIHDEPFGDADFFVKVGINGFWFINEGNQVVDTQDITPGWAFARYVGLSGSAEVVIQVWDEDEDPNPDDKSDINHVEDRRDLNLMINLANGAISGDLTGTCGITLTSHGHEDDCSQIWFRIIMPNIPPTANAGPDQFVEQTSPQGADVTLNGTGSSDPDNDTLTYYWNWTGGSATGATPTALFPPGNTTVTLTVSDGRSNSTDTVNIIVQDTTPPVVDAGPDVTVEQESHAGTQVILNGTAMDAVSTRFNFTWSEKDVVLGTETNTTNATLTYTFNLGVHIITLNATDQAGNMGSDNVTVSVIDTTPPQINVTATPTTLWPPNHKYVEVKVTVTAYDICDPSPKITFLSITSNEPDNSIGDGNTVNDILVIDNFTFNLRAERSGTSSGRIYTITYKTTDASGNYAVASVTIEVPHNQ